MGAICLKEVPKNKPRGAINIDGFIYYKKKDSNYKHTKQCLWGVYHYPSGYLMFHTDNEEMIERFILANHTKLKQLYEEYINTEVKCIESDYQSTSTDKKAV